MKIINATQDFVDLRLSREEYTHFEELKATDNNIYLLGNEILQEITNSIRENAK